VSKLLIMASSVPALPQHRTFPPLLPPDSSSAKKVGEDVLIPLAGDSANFDASAAALPYLAYT